jgi:hypothetical protein
LRAQSLQTLEQREVNEAQRREFYRVMLADTEVRIGHAPLETLVVDSTAPANQSPRMR